MGMLKVFPLVFYPGAFTLKVQIPDLLHAVIEPAQFLLRTGFVSDDFRGGRFCLIDITLHFAERDGSIS